MKINVSGCSNVIPQQLNLKKKVTQTLKLVVLNFECRKPERMISFFVIIFNYCRCHSNTNNHIALLN